MVPPLGAAAACAAWLVATAALMLVLPDLLALLLTKLLAAVVGPGLLSFGSVELSCRLELFGRASADARAHERAWAPRVWLRACVSDFGISNPPGFGHGHFFFVESVHLRLGASLETLWAARRLFRVWSPFPSAQNLPLRGGGALAPVADPRSGTRRNEHMLGTIFVDEFEARGAAIAFETHKGEFSVNAVSRRFAEAEMRRKATLARLPRKTPGAEPPNRLDVVVVAARALTGGAQRPAAVKIFESF